MKNFRLLFLLACASHYKQVRIGRERQKIVFILITNFKTIANKDEKPAWFAYPRWTRDQSGIVYHAAKSLYHYDLESEKTAKVSTDPKGDYRYPHGEATPK